MAKRKKRGKRDIERDYPTRQFVAKLRRLADCIEEGKRFRIQVAGQSVSVSPEAKINEIYGSPSAKLLEAIAGLAPRVYSPFQSI